MNKLSMIATTLGLSATLGIACTSPGAGAPGGDGAGSVAGDLPCEVDAVLAKNCRQCHSSPPSYGAPMPLLSFADLHADAKSTPGKKVFERVGTRIHDDAAPMPQAPNPRLSVADSATLDSWIASGAPAGTAGCAVATAPSLGPTALTCTPDQKIRPTAKFAVSNAADNYVCYGFDVENTVKRHVIAGGPVIDNSKVVHHVLLFQADNKVAGMPAPCGGGGGPGWRLVTGWAPGGKNFELPPEAGFAEEVGTTHWAMQIHYNNAQGLTGQTDGTGFDLCTTDKLRDNDADIMATGTAQINIPPRSTWQQTCNLSVPADFGTINIVSSWAHMHKLGRAESAVRIRDGQETSILDAPNYDFSTGAGANAVNVELKAGDTVRTTCKWQNSGDAAVTFGEATSDEMCFAFLTYYPKITRKDFNWALPATPDVSKCTPSTY